MPWKICAVEPPAMTYTPLGLRERLFAYIGWYPLTAMIRSYFCLFLVKSSLV